MRKLMALLVTAGLTGMCALPVMGTVTHVTGTKTGESNGPVGVKIVSCQDNPNSECCIIITNSALGKAPGHNSGTVEFPADKTKFSFDDAYSGGDDGRVQTLMFMNMKPLK